MTDEQIAVLAHQMVTATAMALMMRGISGEDACTVIRLMALMAASGGTHSSGAESPTFSRSEMAAIIARAEAIDARIMGRRICCG